MSSAERKNVEFEESSSRKQINFKRAKPFAVPSIPQRPGDEVTRRVVEVVNFELAQGSMPA